MSELSHYLRFAVKDPVMDYGDLWAYCKEAVDEIEKLEQRLAAAEAKISEFEALPEWVKAGDGTLHGAIDYWQERASEAEAELNRLRCAMSDEKVASGVLSAFWRRVFGAANFSAFDKQVLTAHMLTALSGIDVFSRCELAYTVCPDCGPVSVDPDIFDKDVPISGICPKCGDRLHFAERGSDE